RQHDHGLVAVGGALALGRLAVDRDVAFVEPLLQAAARELRHQAGDHLVEALAAVLGAQLQGDRFRVEAGAFGRKFGLQFVGIEFVV
nr:hypothetical protein [Tanacetum cinerariifolium]